LFFLNAWIERAAPYMELRNTYTGKVLISLQGEHLYAFLDECGLAYVDLLDRSKLTETIKTLLLATIKDSSCPKLLRQTGLDNILTFPLYKRRNKSVYRQLRESNIENVVYLDKLKSFNTRMV